MSARQLLGHTAPLKETIRLVLSSTCSNIIICLLAVSTNPPAQQTESSSYTELNNIRDASSLNIACTIWACRVPAEAKQRRNFPDTAVGAARAAVVSAEQLP